LEEFLVNYPGAMLIVSHDRVFLNHLIDWIAEIEGQKIDLYYGDYDHYLEEKEARRQILEATYKLSRKKLSRPKGSLSDSGLKTPNQAKFRVALRCLKKLSGSNFRRKRGRYDSIFLLRNGAAIKWWRLKISTKLWRNSRVSGN